MNNRPFKTVTGVLENLQRLPSSAMGNPRYIFTVGGVELRTSPDSSLAYGDVPNNEGKAVTVVYRKRYSHNTACTVDRLKI